MKLKNNFFYTIRENVKDEDSISSNLLVRSGMIKKISSGIYTFMPLGLKVARKIENIIRQEMNDTGASELLMSHLLPVDVLDKSGRNQSFSNSIFRLHDRYEREYVLGPTHEEFFTIAAAQKIRSYKDLPFNLYQFQTKFRDEARPRYGLIRVREFIMKDAYSFDKDLEGLDISYQKMKKAYQNIFDKMNIKYKIVIADTGAMGGMLSEEFQALTDIGEDIVVLCDQCDYASNIEVSECKNEIITNSEQELEKELIHTPNAKTISEIAAFLNLPEDRFVKTIIYKIDNQPYAILISGTDEINETKVRKLLKAETVEIADEETVKKVTNAEVGFAGPINLDIPVIMDEKVLNLKNFIVGANKTDYHYKNVNLQDFTVKLTGDLRLVKEKEKCPICGGKIYFKKGIEVGNIFKLGTKYSEALDLYYSDQNNQLNPVIMGSYGIGIGRIMAAVVEQNNDENGMIWPLTIAPYQVGIVIINSNDPEQIKIANQLYEELKSNNIEVLLDDRDERPGIKFNDLDLIGIPLRITIGNKIKDNLVELKGRTETDSTDILIQDVLKETIKKSS